MKPLPLFIDVSEPERQHPIYRMIRDGDYEAERSVLLAWSKGFEDRDGKFCHEFQVSFEPCLWELYLHAYLKEINASVDLSYSSPDFVVNGAEPFCIEATVAAPAKGQAGSYGYTIDDMPSDMSRFNSEATVRICNSFTSKVIKLRESYAKLPQCQDKPFVLAIASFDRPFSHLAAMRPIICALYGLYHDEEETIAAGSQKMVSYNVNGVMKNESTSINLGYFCTPEYEDVSAVIFSSLATWGKVRAVADNPGALTVYRTFHPNPGSLLPTMRVAQKSDYREHLLDGLCVFHNPFAKHKLNPCTLSHERLAQAFVTEDGELDFVAPDNFLLMRSLMSIKPVTKDSAADS
jgi:hypothetical protein